MVVALLLDASLSMKGHMSEVLAAAKELLERLPVHVHCRVISFGSAIEDRSAGQDNACRPANFILSSIEASGGTPLFGTLDQALTQLKK